MIQASERRTSQNFHSWEATFYLLNTLDPPCSGPYKGQVVINSFSNKTKSFSHTNQIISMRLCTSATNKTSTTPRSRNYTQNKNLHILCWSNILRVTFSFPLLDAPTPSARCSWPPSVSASPSSSTSSPGPSSSSASRPVWSRGSPIRWDLSSYHNHLWCIASDHATFPRDQVYSVSATFQCSSLLSKRWMGRHSIV